jgi:hypothetical protein
LRETVSSTGGSLFGSKSEERERKIETKTTFEGER